MPTPTVTHLLQPGHTYSNKATPPNGATPWSKNIQTITVVYQPAFVLLPVSITGPWYSERSLQVLEEVSQALSRSKRVVVLIIAGIAALIKLISNTTAAIALTQEV